MSDMGDIFNAMRDSAKEHRREMLASADTNGRATIAAVQQVLGPQLGLVSHEEMARAVAVESAYREGFRNGRFSDHYGQPDIEESWTTSDARAALAKAGG